MISPHTPPGTKVVVVKPVARVTSSLSKYKAGQFLRNDRVYTVSGWKSGRYCELAELPDVNGRPIGVDRTLLQYAQLPSCLTDALASQPPIHGREVVEASQ